MGPVRDPAGVGDHLIRKAPFLGGFLVWPSDISAAEIDGASRLPEPFGRGCKLIPVAITPACYNLILSTSSWVSRSLVRS
jgi:hypothetical protein